MKIRIKYSFILFTIISSGILLYSIPSISIINDFQSKPANWDSIYGQQQGNTITVNTKTPDGTGHPNVEVRLDNDGLNLHYQAFTNAQGTAVLNNVVTPVEAEPDNTRVNNYRLGDGFPNPVKESLFKFHYELPNGNGGDIPVNVDIYDALGQHIRTLANEHQEPGKYEVVWDGKDKQGMDVSSGVYFYQIKTHDAVITKKLAKVGRIGGSLSGNLVRKIGGTDLSVGKQGSVDYILSLLDENQQRFENSTEPVTIFGDTTLDRTILERFSWDGPPLIVGKPGDTLGVAYSWANFGTALQELLNQSPDWIVAYSDPDSLYMTPEDPQASGSLPMEFLAKAIYGTEKGVIQPVSLVPPAGENVFGFVRFPDGVAIEDMDVGAYDLQFNFLKNDVTNAQGRYDIDSLTAGIINLIFTDLQNRTDTDTLYNIVLPAQQDKTQRESLAVNQLNFNLDEGDTLVIPKVNWMYATGNVTDFDNLSNEWQMWEDQNNIYLKTTDPNANGLLEALIETTAPHATKDTSVVEVNIADLANFYFEVRDDTRSDSLIVAPTTLHLGSQQFISQDGILQGKIVPNIYSVLATNNATHQVFRAETEDGQWQRYFPGNLNPQLNLLQDVTGTIYMVDSAFHKETWDLEFNRSGGIGSELFKPTRERDLDWIASVVDSMGPVLPYDSTTANIIIWTGPGNLPYPYSKFTEFSPLDPMTDTSKASILDFVQNELPEELLNYYTLNYHVIDDDNIPLRLVTSVNGDTIAIPKKSAVYVYAGFENSHTEARINSTNEINAMIINLIQFGGLVNDKLKAVEIMQGWGPNSDIDDPEHESVNFSLYNVFAQFNRPTTWDRNKAMRLHLKMREGFYFFQ